MSDQKSGNGCPHIPILHRKHIRKAFEHLEQIRVRAKAKSIAGFPLRFPSTVQNLIK